jgi:hypothetical protein
MATSPSALPTSSGTTVNRRRVVAFALVLALGGCLALLVLIGDHGSGSGGRVATSRLDTFARSWFGHGRGLVIRRSGQGREYTRTYWPGPPYYATLRFEVIGVSGPRAAAEARIRVVSIRNPHHTLPRIRVGQLGTLRLRHGVVTDSLTHGTYCSLKPAEKGICGL